MPRRAKAKIDIDVVPYLSVMVIVLKLICLILIVTVMRLALNPHRLSVVSFEGMYQGVAGDKTKFSPEIKKKVSVKIPYYFECTPNALSIFPGEHQLSIIDLAQPSNTAVQILETVEANSSNEYVIVLMRPHSMPIYRYVRKLLSKRKIDIGYDVLDGNARIDWEKEAKSLNITTLPGK
jgi:hypothetical protein